jgi:hypothetical protein
MPTYYKPSVRQNKLWVYRSIDPDEPRRVRKETVWLLAGVIIFLAILCLLSKFGR